MITCYNYPSHGRMSSVSLRCRPNKDVEPTSPTPPPRFKNYSEAGRWLKATFESDPSRSLSVTMDFVQEQMSEHNKLMEEMLKAMAQASSTALKEVERALAEPSPP